MRFMHIADVHLGYQQYGSKERFNDFSAVFLHIVEQAIAQQVAFLLVAGDLFEKRTVDPLAMRVAVEGLRMLQEAGIPVLAVEGNHEKAHYRDQYSWVDFLDGLGYLHLLNPRFEEERVILEPYGEEGGAYLDLPGGVRVYGIKYYGASTGKVFGLFTQALAEIDHSDVQFTILMAHAGLEGQLPRYSGTLTHNDLAPLREQIDYLALGHIHKPYTAEGWIYNPGSPETWSIEETAWPERGYFLVEVQPGSNPNHQARLVSTPRRPFHRSRLEVDALTEPNTLYDAVRKLLQREGSSVPREPAPVVELTLSGILPFNRFDLDLDFVKTLIEEAWSPLVTRVQNRTTPADFEVAVDMEASRPELERAIIRELLERDARYRSAAEEWAQIALDVKRLALEDSTPEAVIDHLRRARAELVTSAGEPAPAMSKGGA
jgi:DNA repair protein SbcD/Mre11